MTVYGCLSALRRIYDQWCEWMDGRSHSVRRFVVVGSVDPLGVKPVRVSVDLKSVVGLALYGYPIRPPRKETQHAGDSQ